jgi:hypothetical protein
MKNYLHYDDITKYEIHELFKYNDFEVIFIPSDSSPVGHFIT